MEHLSYRALSLRIYIINYSDTGVLELHFEAQLHDQMKTNTCPVYQGLPDFNTPMHFSP